MKTVLKFALISSLLAPALGFAGDFNVWSYTSKGKQLDVVVSFAGDGMVQDAQIDFDLPQGLHLIKATELVAGSVCAVSPDGKFARALPPSGAGKALGSSEVDYCKFSFSGKGVGSIRAGHAFNTRLNECASPEGGTKSCGLKFYDVSEQKNRQQID